MKLLLRWNFTPNDDEKMEIFKKFNENLVIPKNFSQTAKGYNAEDPKKSYVLQASAVVNPQTTQLCDLLDLDDPVERLKGLNVSSSLSFSEQQDSSLNCTSFVDDTDVSTSEIDLSQGEDNSSFRRTSLVLPEPKCSTPNVGLSDLKDARALTLNESLNEELTAEDTTTPPQQKKFKRRNASMYENEAL